MKKIGKKGIIGIVIGLIFCAVATPLLVIFIPKLFQKSSISELVENQVKPTQGNGDYLNYSLEVANDAVSSLTLPEKVETIKQFAQKTIKSSDGATSIARDTVSNILVDFFRNIKGSKSYIEKFRDWEKNINDSWNSTIDSYKSQYGSDWQFYFQLKELDPVGGNEDDWKRAKLFEYVNTDFDTLVTSGNFINLVKEVNGKKEVVSNITEEMLFDSAVIFNANGKPCNIGFYPAQYVASDDPSVAPPTNSLDSFNFAIADFRNFIFDRYVREKMPVITSMVLFKHETPASEEGDSDFFNVKLATNLNGGTSPVSTEASYQWQAFNPETTTVDGTSKNGTAKYNDFVRDIQSGSSIKLVLDNMGGAINIPVEYTDDSATLFLINAFNVFTNTYTQYSAAAMFKLNNLLFATTDSNLPSINGVSELKKQGDRVNGGTQTVIPGLEILSNFLYYDEPNTATGYYFALPESIRKIINSNPTYKFDGIYNGAKSITESIDIKNSPFIMTRDEAGVHIIGIDRYKAIKEASTFDEKITEIKNTLFWRHLIANTKIDGASPSETTGFSIDLNSEINTYYNENRIELIISYILSKQKNPPVSDEEKKAYIFSDVYSDMQVPWDKAGKKLISDNEATYFNAYYDFTKYNSYNACNSTIRQKFIELQASYVGKYFGTPDYNDAFVVNGIAGVLPYTRDTTANNVAATDGVYNDVYGTFPSVAWHFPNNKIYENLTAETKKNDFETKALAFLDAETASNPLVPKTLTFQSAPYNQYLEISTKNNDSTKYYASFGDRLNTAIGIWISIGEISNIVYSQKMEAYLDSKNAGINFKNYNFTSDGSENTLPTSNENSLAFVNSRLQYALNLNENFKEVTSSIETNIGNWTNYKELYDLLENVSTASLTNGNYSEEQLTALRNFLTILYAFDFNPDTMSYDFTKFRDYLLGQTNNNGKAVYAWTTSERTEFIQGYDSLSIKNQFAFKPKVIDVSKNTYGYSYINASKTAIKPIPQNPIQFGNDVTFNTNTSYWRFASPDKVITNNTNGYTGFLGMQFPGSTSGNLDGNASSQIFSSNARYFTSDARTDSEIQGVLYNIASTPKEGRKRLEIEIGRIDTSTKKIKMVNWLFNNFKVNPVNETKVNNLKKEIIKEQIPSVFIPKLVELANIMIPDIAFTRVEKQQLVNSKYIVQEPWKQRYFGNDGTSNLYSQVIVTQFNYDDVVKLFDTSDESGNANPDGKITDKDKGINWSVASIDGFLGASPEAFFISAIDWYNNNSLFANNAYEQMKEKMGKVKTFDRRLNDLFGETWVENYKKSQ